MAPTAAKPKAKVVHSSKSTNARSEAAKACFTELVAAYPDAHCELEYGSPFQLLVATVLSAQTTDVAVNKITPELFQKWPTASALAEADASDVEAVLGSIGMFRQKAKNIVGLSQQLLRQHQGEVPPRLEDLVTLPGVGRKTANVVLGVAFGAPEGVVVDTHVQRLAQRLGFSTAVEPAPIERDLMALFPREQWDRLSHTLIFHGRRCCIAKRPMCATCPVAKLCPAAFKAEDVGRKAPQTRSTTPIVKRPR